MQARRLLLFFGIVLLLTAAATSFIPVPEEERQGGDTETSPTEPAEPPPEFQPDRAEVVEIDLEVGEKLRTPDIETGKRVVVTVEAREPGEVELEGLGRIQTVDPTAPAVFDLFTDRRGRFDVVYRSIAGDERTVATLGVGPAVRQDGERVGEGSGSGEGSRAQAGS